MKYLRLDPYKEKKFIYLTVLKAQDHGKASAQPYERPHGRQYHDGGSGCEQARSHLLGQKPEQRRDWSCS
jgi:hypothetical protein